MPQMPSELPLCALRIRYGEDLQVPGVVPASFLPLRKACPRAPSSRGTPDGMTSFPPALPSPPRAGPTWQPSVTFPAQGPPSP